MKINFSTKEYDCCLKWLSYNNGNVAIVACDAKSGLPVGKLTVNTPEILPPDAVAIKNYSENDGVLESLIDNGVVSEIQHYIPSGYVQIPVCIILNKLEK